MSGFKLEDFQGIVPRLSARLLPPTAATTARNTKLLNGELRGFRQPTETADFTDGYITVRRAYRVPDTDGVYYGDTWLTFDSVDVDVIRSPIINDSYDRYYWAGDGRPQYNTANRIRLGLEPYYLGVPAPLTAPVVTPPIGTDFTRAYLYTFESAYGEEGMPSPPTVTSGNDGAWTLSSLSTTVPDSSHRRIRYKNIYRTVVGQATTDYYFVAKIPVAQSTFVDTADDTDVVQNNILESATFAEPPTDLEGWVLMPNGYLVGWAGRRLIFSEPYRPHAFPAAYELATEFEIRGLVVWGTTLIIGTASQPYLGQGVHPASFTMEKMDAVEPCLSRRGMVATVAGAFYPSINGLVLVNSNGVQVITQDIVTKEEWASYNPEDFFAAQLGLQYIAFNSPSFGIIINPTEPKTKLVELDRFSDVTGIETDRYSGNVQIINQNRLFDWDPEAAERLFWRWKSKQFFFPKPMNFGAARISFEAAENDITDFVAGFYLHYNEERFVAPLPNLGTLGGHCLCGDPQNIGQIADWTEPELRMPLGGDSLYPIAALEQQQPAIRFIVYANGVVKYDKVVSSEAVIRLPTGFKSTLWQFEFVGNTTMYSVQIAETVKGLAEI